jgi:hypothetical protein
MAVSKASSTQTLTIKGTSFQNLQKPDAAGPFQAPIYLSLSGSHIFSRYILLQADEALIQKIM